MERSSILGIIGMVLGGMLARYWFPDGGFLTAVLGGAIGGGVGGGLGALLDEAIKRLKKQPVIEKDTSSADEIAVASEAIVTPVTESKGIPFYYGFGGWLYLVTIGQLFILYNSISTLFGADIPLLSSSQWVQLTDPQSADYNPIWEPFIYFEMVGCTVFILFILMIGYLTIKLSRYYKRLQISLYVFNVVYAIIVMIFMLSLNSHYQPPVYPEDDFVRIISQTTVASLIWIPYFMVSKRVKNTFNR